MAARLSSFPPTTDAMRLAQLSNTGLVVRGCPCQHKVSLWVAKARLSLPAALASLGSQPKAVAVACPPPPALVSCNAPSPLPLNVAAQLQRRQAPTNNLLADDLPMICSAQTEHTTLQPAA